MISNFGVSGLSFIHRRTGNADAETQKQNIKTGDRIMKAILAALALAITFGSAAQAATQVSGNAPAWVVSAFSNAE